MIETLYLYLIQPIESVMRSTLELTYFTSHSYGAAVVLLAVFVSLATLPLYAMAEAAQHNDRRIRAALAPSLTHIRRAFRGQERFFMVRTLYRQHGYHPVLGLRASLGLLVQVPFFIAAFLLLRDHPPLAGVSYLWFDDLARPDALVALGPVPVNVMPLVMTAVSLCAAHLYTDALDRRERIQLYALAVLFLVLLYDSPVALVLYWTVNNLFALGKQLLARRAAQLPLLPAFGRLTAALTPGSPVLVALVVLVAVATPLQLRHAVPGPLGTALDVVSLGVLLYLSLLAVGALVRSFRPTPLGIGVAVLIVLLYLATVGVAFNVLGAHDVAQALGHQRNRIWVGLTLVTVGALAGRFSLPDGPPLLSVDAPLRLSLLAGAVLVAVLCVYAPVSLLVSDPTALTVTLPELLSGTVVLAGIALAAVVVTYFALAPRLRSCYALPLTVAAALGCLYTFVLVGEFGSIDHFVLDRSPALTARRMLADVVAVSLVVALVGWAFWRNHSRAMSRLLAIALVSTLAVAGHRLAQLDGTAGEAQRPMSADGLGLAPLPPYNEQLLGYTRTGRNVVVVMLDAFNAYTLPVTFEREPELRERLDGFTWFRNALAPGYVTALGEPAIHGGHRYTAVAIRAREYESLTDESAMGYRVFADSSAEAGYEVSLAGVQHVRCDRIVEAVRYPPVTCTGNEYEDDYVRSVAWPGREDVSLLDGTEIDVRRVDQRLVLTAVGVFRAAPFALKEAVYSEGTWMGTYPHAQKHVDESKHAARDLVGLYALSRAGVVTDAERSTFKYIQNNTTHRPFYITPDTCLPSLAQSDDEVARDCALRLVADWVEWLDAHGVYENTMIVLVSDHGSRRQFGNALGVPLTRTNALLMVKDFGERGPLVVDDTFMSSADVPAIVCSAIGGCPGIVPDPRGNTEPRTLYFVMGSNKRNEKRVSDENVVYAVEDSIFDPSNWRVVE